VTIQGAAERLDRWQRDSALVAFPVAVAKKFVDDRGPRIAVQVAYWGFFSAFALLLVFVALLGFAFHGDPSFQHDVRASVLERMPVLGAQIDGSVGTLKGSAVALVVGVLGALWTGLGVTLAIGEALDRVWAVPLIDRPGFVSARARGLLVVAMLGTVTVAATAVVGLATQGGIDSWLAQLASVAGSFAFDLLVFVACFRVLTAARVSTRAVLPGAVVATLGLGVMQAIGAVYITYVVENSSDTYGGFAVVVGLLSWLFVLAQVTLFAAEVNVVLAWRLWPRSLRGHLLPADERALRAAVEAERRDARERIAVTFE
jgi:membrane protein